MWRFVSQSTTTFKKLLFHVEIKFVVSVALMHALFARTMEPTSNLTTPLKYLWLAGENPVYGSHEIDKKSTSTKHCWSYTLQPLGGTNCYACHTCCLELAKLPPNRQTKNALHRIRIEEREIKRPKKDKERSEEWEAGLHD